MARGRPRFTLVARLRLDRFAVGAEFLDHGAMGSQGFNCLGAFGCGLNLTIDVEDVLPWFAMNGTGFDLGQVRAHGGEFIQGSNERSRSILDREGDADLICMGFDDGVGGAADEEEARVIFGIVFDTGTENFRTVVVSRRFAGDCSGMFVAQFDQLLDASGGVVEGV